MAVGLSSGVRAVVGLEEGEVQPPGRLVCVLERLPPGSRAAGGSGRGRPGLGPLEAVPAVGRAP